MTRNKLQVIDPNVNKQKLRDMGICLVAFLDAFRKRTNDDKFAVRLRVPYKSMPYYYTTRAYVTHDEYEQIRAGRPHRALLDMRVNIYTKFKKSK